MLVLKSTFDQKLDEIDQQKQRITRLEAQVRDLESQNNALENELATSASSLSSTSHPVLDNIVEAFDQLSRVRESLVASSYFSVGQSSADSDFDSLFSESGSSLSEIIRNMEQLSTRMTQMSDSISGLSETADSINKFVSTITSISDQTNLLALNAAIEAARAGDAGRGFSVVADEVRALATETNTSASEVADLVQKIIHSTREAVDAVSELKSNNEHLSEGVQTLNGSYEEIVTRCNSMQSSISQSSSSAAAQAAVLDVLAWKGDVYAMVSGKRSVPSSDFFSQSGCYLGKWMAEQSGQPISNKAAYRELTQPLSRMLQDGERAVNEANANNESAMASHLQSMEASSAKLIQLLERLRSE